MNREARDRAAAAIASARIDDASPFAASEALAKAYVGAENADDALARLRFWEKRVPGTRIGDDRYRWEISHKRCKGGAHVPPRAEWKTLRPEERDAELAEIRISLPLAVADGCEYLAKLTARGGEVGARASALLAEAEPLFRRDLAAHVQAQNPWSDTFALRSVTLRPLALERLRPLALAIAVSYAATVNATGAVLGMRYPLHDRPMTSATAHLASGLLALGHDLPLLGKLLSTVRDAQHDNGGFGDDMPDATAEKFGREDLLTTVAAADVLGTLDPSFDLERALAWCESKQRKDGFFVAYGPEIAWLTGEIVRLADAAARPFAERFRFPQVPSANLDRKTGLPFFAFFDDLTHLFAELSGLAGARVPIAFLDLAGFGKFNNAHGQDVGDAVLALLARELSSVAFARAIRDGGDEFIVVGAPERTHLARDLDVFRASWPARFRSAFGANVPTVAPRILVTEVGGRELRGARERLGRSMGTVKDRSQSPPPEGVLDEI